MKKVFSFLKKIIYGIIVISVPIILSIITYFLVEKELIPKEDWISVYCAIIGGITTLLGLIITININNRRNREEDINKIKPYLMIDIFNQSEYASNVYDFEDKKVKESSEKIENHFIRMSKDREAEPLVDLKRFRVFGKLVNIGLGACTDVFLENITLGTYNFRSNRLNGYKAIQVNQEIYIDINFLEGCPLFYNFFGNQFVKDFENFKKTKHLKNAISPTLNFNFDIIYTDLLENTYCQHVELNLVVVYRKGSYIGIPILKRISSPTMMNESKARRLKKYRNVDSNIIYNDDKIA